MRSPEALNVSRETFERLVSYEALLQKWTPKINLISRATASQIWERHILDSLQIYALAPEKGHWVDLGSGGGLPGIVVAILTAESADRRPVTLVESDQRKCAFLRTAVRELNLSANIRSERIEAIAPLGADILSARALADLSTLFTFAERHLAPDGIALFPKGAQWEKEHADARTMWRYTLDPITSKTHPEAAILRIKDLARV